MGEDDKPVTLGDLKKMQAGNSTAPAAATKQLILESSTKPLLRLAKPQKLLHHYTLDFKS